MIDYIINNLASIIVGIIVFSIILAILIKLINDRRYHRNSCAGGCGHCPLANECQGAKTQKQKSRH